MFKKIWKDPVWSKVIAGIILAIGSLLVVWIKSLIDKTSFQTALKGLFEAKIKIVFVLAIFILYFIAREIYRKYNLPWKRKRFAKIHKSFNKETGNQYHWDTCFINGLPAVLNLKVSCTKHGAIPIQFIYGRCPKEGCENSVEPIDEARIINLIESYLIHAWENNETIAP
jgi:hypothetical protein